MSSADRSSDPRIDELARQVSLLTARVDQLAEDVKRIARRVAVQSRTDENGEFQEVSGEANPVPESSEPPIVIHAVKAPDLLTNVAIVCFLLVIALVLRTIVDSEMVDERAGFVFGVGYAGLLIALGGLLYIRRNPRASLIAVSGILLVLSIIFESHTLFEIVSTPAAYFLLGVVLLPATVWGLRYGATTACYVGLFGASICGIAIEFPDPTYNQLALLLLLATVCAFFYLGKDGSRLLMSLHFVLSMFFWLLWAIKTRAALSESDAPLEALHLPWVIPMLAAFALAYVAAAIRIMLRDKGELGPFELAVPTINVLWAYIAAQSIVSPWLGRSELIGIAGVLVAASHLVLCVWFMRREIDRHLTSSSFAVAGVVLLLVALPACTPTPYWAVAAWSLVALCLAVAAGMWRIKAIRFVSYLLQIVGVVAAASWGMMAEATPFPAPKVALLVFTACCTCTHFYWCRLRDPLSPTPLFRSASTLTFLACIAYAFGTARIVLYAALTSAFDEVAQVFLAGQSLILNGIAVTLMLVALRRNNTEILLTSTVVACVAAVKVFGYDFLNTADLPRVLSVASSGAAAAIGSYVWSSWQRRTESPHSM